MKLRDYRFPEAQLSTKPGPGGKRLTYVDIRYIQNALDQLAPGWQSSIVLDGNRAVCTIILDGVTRADVGEGETVFDASNQAFRRCAAAHGLGRYLWLDEVPNVPQAATTAAPSEDNPFSDSSLLCEGTRRRLHQVGSKCYGAEWDDRRHQLVGAISHGTTESSKKLSEAQAKKLIAGIEAKLALATVATNGFG